MMVKKDKKFVCRKSYVRSLIAAGTWEVML